LQLWLRKQAVLGELHGCDDRALQDLGILRSDFDAVASDIHRRDGGKAAAPPGGRESWPYF
jgi:uncharacterized protein YjiS (DUF1127 family)